MNVMRTSAFASALLAATGVGGAAYAHTVYQLQGNQWAIICDNGTGYSFSGSAEGAVEVAGLLCAGGMVTNPGSVNVAQLQDSRRHIRRERGRWVLARPIGITEDGIK
jgi:hypothetical protein